MKRSRFTEEQILYAPKQAEAGIPVTDVGRKVGVSEVSFFRWRKKYANLDLTELRELRQFHDENARLNRLVADLTLNRTILQKGGAIQGLKLVRRRDLVPGSRTASESAGCARVG